VRALGMAWAASATQKCSDQTRLGGTTAKNPVDKGLQ